MNKNNDSIRTYLFSVIKIFITIIVFIQCIKRALKQLSIIESTQD